MKLLMLTRYQRLGASSRLRSLQYLPSFADAGIDAVVAPLFSDDYVEDLQKGRRRLTQVLPAYCRRTVQLLSGGSFDLIWIEKECLPWVPYFLERLLLGSRVPYVLDYDDAVFHRYDGSRNPLVRHALGKKHGKLMRDAAQVICGNRYLADVAKAAGAKMVAIVPTAVDLDRYPLRVANEVGAQVADVSRCVTVGWIGQRASAGALQPLASTFEAFAARGGVQFAAIGIDAAALRLPMRSVRWSEATEVDELRKLDIGIMPLPDEAFERGKCGYKLIQYMACGLPVVASPVGANRDIVEHGVNGLLASTPAEWESALGLLIGDADLRARMGVAGRRRVEEAYCTRATGPALIPLIHEASREPRA